MRHMYYICTIYVPTETVCHPLWVLLPCSLQNMSSRCRHWFVCLVLRTKVYGTALETILIWYQIIGACISISHFLLRLFHFDFDFVIFMFWFCHFGCHFFFSFFFYEKISLQLILKWIAFEETWKLHIFVIITLVGLGSILTIYFYNQILRHKFG